jgi:cell division protein FtsW
MKSEDLFAKYVALGIVTWISLQTFINMGVNLNIVPLTGTTLPFVSYGGSSLLSFLLAFGILLNISRSISPEAPLEKSRAFRRRYTWMKKVATMVRR